MSARQNRIRAERAAKRALKALTNNETLPVAVAAPQQPISAPPSAPEPAPVTLPSGDVIPEPGIRHARLSQMTSAAQLAANRANAQFSSGPKTAAGLAVSSQNRTIHGLARHNGAFRLLATEDPNGFEALKAALASEHQPETETEAILIQSMAESHWLSQRADALLFTCTHPETGEITDAPQFCLYLRYQTTHTRAFHKSLNDLLKLRKDKRQAANGFEAQKRAAAQLVIQQDRIAMQKQRHFWDVTFKDAATCGKLVDNLIAQNQGILSDPHFHAKYEAELASFGLKRHARGGAVAA